MQPTTSSSQSQDQAATANITKPEDNQQPSTAFVRTVSAARDHASTSTASGESLAERADTSSDRGLVARTVTETQTLSVQNKPLTDALQLPAGHTYQPYFWLSELAHRLMAPPVTKHTAEMQLQVIVQLVTSLPLNVSHL